MKKQLGTVGATLEATERRTRAMGKKLRDVQTLPADQAAVLLAMPEVASDSEADEPVDE